MKTQNTLLIAALTLLTTSTQAQDLLRTGKDTIKCYITEVGIDETRCRPVLQGSLRPVGVLDGY